jgi:hypothetical protein
MGNVRQALLVPPRRYRARAEVAYASSLPVIR